MAGTAVAYGTMDETIRDGDVVRWHDEIAYSDHERAERFVVRCPDYATGRCTLVLLGEEAERYKGMGFPAPRCMSTLRHVTHADDWDGPTEGLYRGPFRIQRGNPGHVPAYADVDERADYWDAVLRARELAGITGKTHCVRDANDDFAYQVSKRR